MSVSPNCYFDNDLCTWQQSVSDQFNWTLSSGATTSTGTGPLGDHTPNENGKFFYSLFYCIFLSFKTFVKKQNQSS